MAGALTANLDSGTIDALDSVPPSNTDTSQWNGPLSSAAAAQPVPARGGALLPSPPTPNEDPNIAYFAKLGRQMLEGNDGQSPLSSFNDVQTKRDNAAAQKMAAINRAMALLQQTGASQTTNLPLIAAAGALMAPTRTGSFGESLSNATAAGVPVLQQQRAVERQQAGQTGQLDVAANSVPWDEATADQNALLERMRLGESAMSSAANLDYRDRMIDAQNQRAVLAADTRTNIAGMQVGSRENIANLNNGTRVNVAGIKSWTDLQTRMKPVVVASGPTIQTFYPQTGEYVDTGVPTTAQDRANWQQQQGDQRLGIMQQNADTARARLQKENSQYLGTDPDTKQGVYLDKNTGLVTLGQAVDPRTVGGAGADPARIREAKSLVQNGVAPDFTSAYAMVRAGVNDSSVWQREVQAEMNTLVKTPEGMSMTYDDLRRRAEQGVVERAQRQPPKVAPGLVPAPAPGTPPTPGAAATPPQSTPVIPGAAAPQQTPAPAAATPRLRTPTPDEVEQARTAVSKGAPFAKVQDAFRNRGIDPSGL